MNHETLQFPIYKIVAADAMHTIHRVPNVPYTYYNTNEIASYMNSLAVRHTFEIEIELLKRRKSLSAKVVETHKYRATSRLFLLFFFLFVLPCTPQSFFLFLSLSPFSTLGRDLGSFRARFLFIYARRARKNSPSYNRTSLPWWWNM